MSSKPLKRNNPHPTAHTGRQNSLHLTKTTISPIPSPEDMFAYGNTDPSFPNRLMTTYESLVAANIDEMKAQGDHARDIDRGVLGERRRGQLIAAGAIVLFVGLAVFFQFMGNKEGAIAASGAAGLTPLVSAFLPRFIGRFKDQKSKE